MLRLKPLPQKQNHSQKKKKKKLSLERSRHKERFAIQPLSHHQQATRFSPSTPMASNTTDLTVIKATGTMKQAAEGIALLSTHHSNSSRTSQADPLKLLTRAAYP